MATLVLHIGAPVHIACDRDGKHHRGTSVHGDVDIIPFGTASRWEIADEDTALILSFSEPLLQSLADQTGQARSGIEIANRFQIRDRSLECLAWAMREEMSNGHPNGPLYRDSLAVAMGIHLIHHHSNRPVAPRVSKGGLTGQKLKNVLGHIEDRLETPLSLAEIADVAGLSVSHCAAAFRQSMGRPLHRYVLERRLDRARKLLIETDADIRQVAIESGFSHASHLSRHMRRVLNCSPASLRAQR